MENNKNPEEFYTGNTPMPFGKHKGKKLGNIPAAYFIYLIDNGGTNDKKLNQYMQSNEQAFKLERCGSQYNNRKR